jgi:hypothetical protein
MMLTLLILLFPSYPLGNYSQLVIKSYVRDTVIEGHRVSADLPLFSMNDETSDHRSANEQNELANELNDLIDADVRRRMSSKEHLFLDTLPAHYRYEVTYLDMSILSCRITLTSNGKIFTSYALNYDVSNDGPFLLSKITSSVDKFDTLYTKWTHQRDHGRYWHAKDLTDLSWYVTPDGIALTQKHYFDAPEHVELTIVRFKDNPDLFQRRLAVVSRAFRN